MGPRAEVGGGFPARSSTPSMTDPPGECGLEPAFGSIGHKNFPV
jgi:hypothetical protein